jgi:GR25 family glycosyltransferase involved in LPS biosynthesis
MKPSNYPVYVIIQDPTPEDEAVLANYSELISKVIPTQSNGRGVEELINANRILAWKNALVFENHDYVICLEDDVEISLDFFEFTEQVLNLNKDLKKFMGVNYGSFETNFRNGSFSKIRYCIHGPASLVTWSSFKKFKTGKLSRFRGKIAWDSWVEPIAKMGFMATSNIAKYRDNGINGTHTSSDATSEYFVKLNNSFQYGADNPSQAVWLENVSHTWRTDCILFLERDNLKYLGRKIVIRAFQYLKLILRK